MRFKATFTDHGLRRLEKGFLPTLEKCGKVVDILLSAEEVNFIQTGLHTDSSLSACARFNTNALFKTEDFKLSSMHENVVAFSTDLGLLLRALRSSSTNSADTVSIKLIKKLPPGCTDTDPKFKKPCLSIAAMSSAMSLVQELFVGTPYKADRINELVETKDMGVMCPYYIDIHPWIDKLQAMADKMKTICDTVKVSTCKNGDFYADVSDFNVQLGMQLCACQIYPQETVAAVEADRSLSVTNQLAAATESGDAISVDLPIKHLIRVLNVSSISSPNLILCGIPPGRELMHVMFAYHEAGSVDRYDDTMAMSIKIPSCLPG